MTKKKKKEKTQTFIFLNSWVCVCSGSSASGCRKESSLLCVSLTLRSEDPWAYSPHGKCQRGGDQGPHVIPPKVSAWKWHFHLYSTGQSKSHGRGQCLRGSFTHNESFQELEGSHARYVWGGFENKGDVERSIRKSHPLSSAQLDHR